MIERALLVVLLLTTSSFAHDAPATIAQPKGWSYPFSCCGGYDCRAVPDDWIKESPAGYEIVLTNEVLPYKDARVRHSPDGLFHWCSVAGSLNGDTICLFVPPRSF